MPTQDHPKSYVDPFVASMDADGLADLRRAVLQADEADLILMSGMSREDWLAELDQALADGGRVRSSGPGAS